MKLAVVYHSETCHTQKMAQCICEGAMEIAGIEAKAFSIDEMDEEFLKHCDGMIVGSPTYHGSLSGKMKMWLEHTPHQFNMGGKLAGAFATAGYVHGGGDLAIQCILTHLLVEGMLAYSGGHVFGQPVIHLGPVAISSNLDEYAEVFKTYGRRFATQLSKMPAHQ